MKNSIKFLLLFSFIAFNFNFFSYAYLLGFKSFDNTVDNIVNIEKQYEIYLPIVSFIYDPREQRDVPERLKEIKEKLGSQRIYHLSISPNAYTAEQVAQGYFDKQYLAFFQTIKELDLKVIFRTMHEMNGGRYPRSSNPESFKKAWIHVWELSRSVDLDKNHILFDFSVNARDLPVKNGKPSQKAQFIECKPNQKIKLKCPSFEDYYPGDTYVDLVGFTFYNRGKGNSNRWRGHPDQIANHKERKTLERIKNFKKPIFIDEVATSAVNYTGQYSYEKSLKSYQTQTELKDKRILELRDFLQRETQIVGAIYFNVDLTNGLSYQIIGELDRALINLTNGKFYQSFRNLYQSSNLKIEGILELFGLKETILNGKTFYLSQSHINKIQEIEKTVSSIHKETKEKALFYAELAQHPSQSTLFNQAINTLNKAYPL